MALVLSRREGEKVYVGDSVVIQVRRIQGDRVRLVFHAPKEVVILRGELRKDQKPEAAAE